MIEFYTVPTNEDLYSMFKDIQKEINELKKDNDELKRSLSYQLNILL